MGLDITIYQVDFKQLSVIIGSNNDELIDSVAPLLECVSDAYEDQDAVGEEIITPMQALAATVAGDVPDEYTGTAYSEAVAAIYAHVGAHVGDIHVASWGASTFLSEVDAALVKEGFGALLTDLGFGGTPMRVPLGDEPVLGFISPETVKALGASIAHHDWSSYPDGIRETIEDLGRWIRYASNEGHGLVGIVT